MEVEIEAWPTWPNGILEGCWHVTSDLRGPTPPCPGGPQYRIDRSNRQNV